MAINTIVKKLVILRLQSQINEMNSLLDHPALISYLAKMDYKDYLQNSLTKRYPSYYRDAIDCFIDDDITTSKLLEYLSDYGDEITLSTVEDEIKQYFRDKNYKISGLTDYSILSQFNTFDDFFYNDEVYSLKLVYSLANKNYCDNTYKFIIVIFVEKIIQDIELELTKATIDSESAIQLIYLSEKRSHFNRR